MTDDEFQTILAEAVADVAYEWRCFDALSTARECAEGIPAAMTYVDEVEAAMWAEGPMLLDLDELDEVLATTQE